MKAGKILIFLCSTIVSAFSGDNLVFNGSFELLNSDGIPQGWSYAGNSAVKQRLSSDIGRDGGRCIKLECVEFAGDGPDYHAMICQVGRVSVRKGRWYKLTFWAKGEGIRGGAVDVALNNTSPWENVGLSEAFLVKPQWEENEIVFRARSDLPATRSRLQFWFKSRGKLWLDDVELVEIEGGQQWFPQITAGESKNLVPNSSFECGTAGWGGLTYGLSGWGGNLYWLIGEIDSSEKVHGKYSLKVSLNLRTAPVYYFDYYQPVEQKIKRALVANYGWFKVVPNELLTFSAYIRADSENTVVQMLVQEAPSRQLRKEVKATRKWQRFEFVFTPSQPFIFIALGIDLEASQRDKGTIWIDAIQLEKGARATEYTVRNERESFIVSEQPGNIFTDPIRGITAAVFAFNNSDVKKDFKGILTATDFFDKEVLRREITITAEPFSTVKYELKNVIKDKYGFFRINWSDGVNSNSIRCAIIPKGLDKLVDSPYGFNHAYPWDFLLQQAQKAGVLWWRDWSAKWDTVEPQKGKFDFSVPDVQIGRVLKLNGNALVLLPFPSAGWSSSATKERVDKAAGSDDYLKARLPMAFAPKNLEDFANYAAEVVKHYSKTTAKPVRYYHILNEPIYISYALPRQFGYALDDYLKLLQLAYQKMKEANPNCRIVGGMGANLEAGLTADFVKMGGLKYVDVLDIHNYDPPRPAESYEESFKSLQNLMRATGIEKPIWMTEWGCYGDDDPPCIPHSVGDAAMNRSRWRSERDATEHIVKFTAVSFAYGMRKIFFHAGTAGTINLPDAGGVLFEYGGTPRKMYPAVAVLTKILGVPDECVEVINHDDIYGYLFRRSREYIMICWCKETRVKPLKLRTGTACYDIMGNKLPDGSAIGSSPVYIIGQDKDSVIRCLLY